MKAARDRADAFLEELGALTENRPPAAIRQQLEADPSIAKSYDFDSHTVRVVLSVREDYLPFLLKQRRRFSGVSYNQCRLEPMNGEEAWQVILQRGGANLIDERTALRILGVVTSSHEEEPQGLPPLARADLADLKVDPALLNVVCRGLNDERQKRGLPTITPDLVDEIHGSILERFYEAALEGLPLQTRLFIEDRLLSSSGEYRQSIALEEACECGDLTREQAGLLVDRRLLHLEERDGAPHLELSHDRLTHVVKKSRDNRRRKHQLEAARRRARRWTAAAAVLSLTVIGLLGEIINYYNEHAWPYEYYYAGVTKKRGVYHGIGKRLTLQAVKEREVSYKFSYRGTEEKGKLLSMAAVDSRFHLTANNQIGTYLHSASDAANGPRHECQWEYALDANENLISEMAFDSHHHLVWSFNLPAPNPADEKRQDSGRIRVGCFVGPNGLPLKSKENGVTYIRITYDRNGDEIEQAYENAAGTPVTALDGAFGKLCEYDATGRCTSSTSIGIDGHPMNDQSWNATMKVEYNDSGDPTEYRAYDASGNPTLVNQLYHGARFEYDRWGNATHVTFFDLDGKTPCVTTGGYAGWKNTFEHGRMLSQTFLGIDGQPCLSNGVAIVEYQYDDEGREIERSFYDTDHKRTLSNQGIAGIRNKYDQAGYVAETGYFGLDGQTPSWNSEEGDAGRTSKYDKTGNEITTTYLGVDGQPSFNKNKIARCQRVYDDQGRQTKGSYYDLAGKPCLSDEQIAGWTTEYNELGYEAKYRYFGVDGEPCLSNKGYAGISREYNGYGKVVRETYFGSKRGPNGSDFFALDQTLKVAGWQYEYDEMEREKIRSAVGEEGEPCLSSAGYCSLRTGYDSRGLVSSVEYLGIDGKRSLNLGISGKRNLIQPVNNDAGGFAYIKMKYDERGRLRTKTFSDGDGKLRLDSEGFAGWTSQYNDPNHPDRETKATYFGVDGSTPCVCNDGTAGLATTYDARGRRAKESYLGVDGKPCLNNLKIAGVKSTYDERNREVKREFFGIDGITPCESSEGIAGWKSEYDAADRVVRRVFLAPNGQPVLSATLKKAGWEQKFDARGDVIWEADLDVNLQPLRAPSAPPAPP